MLHKPSANEGPAQPKSPLALPAIIGTPASQDKLNDAAPPNSDVSSLLTSSGSGPMDPAETENACTRAMIQVLTKDELKELIKDHNLTAPGINKHSKDGECRVS